MNEYTTATRASKIFGCSRTSVCRAAKSSGLGVFANGRLAAIKLCDLKKIKTLIRTTAGNPNWISSKRTACV